MTMHLREMDERTRRAAMKTIYDPTVQNPRATELRHQALEMLNDGLESLSSNELTTRTAALQAVHEAERPRNSHPVDFRDDIAEVVAPEPFSSPFWRPTP